MSAPAIIAWLLLAAFFAWFCRTETPAVARHRDDVEDAPMQTATGRWGE